MGIYLNPENETKEQYLKRESTEFPINIALKMGFIAFVQMGFVPVVWLDNNSYTAVAIIYCQNEFDYLLAPEWRTKKMYLVPIAVIEKEVPEITELIEKYGGK